MFFLCILCYYISNMIHSCLFRNIYCLGSYSAGSFHVKTANICIPCTWHLSDFIEKWFKYALCYQMKKSKVSGQYLKQFAHGGILKLRCHTPSYSIGITKFNFCCFWRPHKFCSNRDGTLKTSMLAQCSLYFRI